MTDGHGAAVESTRENPFLAATGTLLSGTGGLRHGSLLSFFLKRSYYVYRVLSLTTGS